MPSESEKDVAESLDYLTREVEKSKQREADLEEELYDLKRSRETPRQNTLAVWISPVVSIMTMVSVGFVSMGRSQQNIDTEQQQRVQMRQDMKDQVSELWSAVHAIQAQNAATNQGMVELQVDMRFVKSWVEKQDQRKP